MLDSDATYDFLDLKPFDSSIVLLHKSTRFERAAEWRRDNAGNPIVQHIRLPREIDAVILQARGPAMSGSKACTSCLSGSGPFSCCVAGSYGDLKTCANCIWRSRPSQCSFGKSSSVPLPFLPLTSSSFSSSRFKHSHCG